MIKKSESHNIDLVIKLNDATRWEADDSLDQESGDKLNLVLLDSLLLSP